MKKKRLINDIILIAVLVIIPVVMLVYGNLNNNIESDALAVITIDGSLYKTLPLSKDLELTVSSENGINVVVIRDGSVWVSTADCPNQLCVDHNPISKTGEQIVCLPHKVVIEIISKEDSEIDSIAH